ncbi:MAG: hypothetical protein AABY36_06140, partial [Campylobacterota bacterium]
MARFAITIQKLFTERLSFAVARALASLAIKQHHKYFYVFGNVTPSTNFHTLLATIVDEHAEAI